MRQSASEAVAVMAASATVAAVGRSALQITGTSFNLRRSGSNAESLPLVRLHRPHGCIIQAIWDGILQVVVNQRARDAFDAELTDLC